MKLFKVLGSGCANCTNTAKLIEKVAQQQGVAVDIEKVTDLETIMHFNVMSTPAVVLDDKLVHSGSIPQVAMIESWLRE